MGGGPPCFPQDSPCPVVLWIPTRITSAFAYRTVTFSGPPFQVVRLASVTLYGRSATPYRLSPYGLGSSPFARRYLGNRSFFLFLRVLRCFSSPGSPPCPMCSDMDTWPYRQVGSPIRISTGQRLLAARRSFSQLATSFLGSWCPGIRPVPFLA